MNLKHLKEIEGLATPAPWEGNLRLTAEPLERVGSYVQDCVNNGPGKDFMIVMGKHIDGDPADVCHTGNGHRSQANSILISTARNLLPELLALWEALNLLDGEAHHVLPGWVGEALDALNAKADTMPSPLNP